MAIAVRSLTKTYKTPSRRPGLRGAVEGLLRPEHRYTHAVKEISFAIAPGEFIGFVGPNGAGKTTTLKMLSGVLYPSAGEARVLGFEPFRRQRDFLKQISIVMGQKNQLTWELPALEYFRLIKEMYRIPTTQFKEQLDYLSRLLQVDTLFDRQVRSLSLGERMKCELIASLLHRPKVLFLDEPTIGLDIVSQRAIRDFLKLINREEKTTVLLTSHYMDDIQQLCDRVLIIREGALIADEKVTGLISSRAPFKWLVITMPTYADAKEIAEVVRSLEGFGKVEHLEPTIFKIRVPLNLVKEACQTALSLHPTLDFTVQEPDLEEVMGQIFTEGGGVA